MYFNTYFLHRKVNHIFTCIKKVECFKVCFSRFSFFFVFFFLLDCDNILFFNNIPNACVCSIFGSFTTLLCFLYVFTNLFSLSSFLFYFPFFILLVLFTNLGSGKTKTTHPSKHFGPNRVNPRPEAIQLEPARTCPSACRAGPRVSVLFNFGFRVWPVRVGFRPVLSPRSSHEWVLGRSIEINKRLRSILKLVGLDLEFLKK